MIHNPPTRYKALYFLTPLLLTAILVRIFIFDSFTVIGNSMAPTIQEGDHVFVNKMAYWFKGPSKNDIVVGNFRGLEGTKAIKRTVAVPGEWIRIENSSLVASAEREAQGEVVGMVADIRLKKETGDEKFKYRLDPHEYFLSGDNEVASIDSFELGPVDVYNIDGKVVSAFRLSGLKFMSF